MFIKDAAVRAWIYGIVGAAGYVAFIYGLVNLEQLGAWLALGGAVLGVSNTLALGNTPARKQEYLGE